MPQRYRITKRSFALAGGALLLFIVGTSVQAGWVLAIAALLLGILVTGIVLPVRGLAGIEIERHVPRAVTAGDPVPVTIGVKNTSRRVRALIRVTDEFCGSASAVVGVLPAGETREYSGRRTGARRGVYADGEYRLVTGVPFGAARTTRSGRTASPIVVYPRTYHAPPDPMRGSSGFPAPASVGDVSSVREYRPGDPLRHIHWRSVARRGRLVVRDFDTERTVQTAVVAHAGPESEAQPDVADAVASVACSLALSGLREGDVDLIASTGADIATLRAHGSSTVLEWGARLSSSTRGLGDVLRAVGDVPAVVCVCDAATGGADALHDLASRSSLFVVLITSSGTSAETSDKTSAETPEGTASRLRGTGAAVVELRPEDVETWFESGCAVG
jgi:uncharacterized protein (DUF58 family)